MVCYHGVISLDHEIKGSLKINREDINFTGGRGYIEKDWGKAMPKAWIWLQCNHFEQAGISLTLSVAKVPLGPVSFKGFIVGLLLNGVLHRFATYTGARISNMYVTDNKMSLEFKDRNKKLQILAKRISGGFLQAPTVFQMDRRITESISAEVEVRLSIYDGGVWKNILTSKGKHAGLEIVGDLEA